MTQELVPVSHDRAAWNTIHGAELRDHNDALTAEQAKAINQQVDMQVYLGAHMQGANYETGVDIDVTPDEAIYDEVRQVVDSMKQGDTLFIESMGFRKPVVAPIPTIDFSTKEIKPSDDPVKRIMAGLAALAMEIYKEDFGMLNEHNRAYSAWLEGLKQKRQINTFTYAAGLARLKGINVVHADIDAYERQVLMGLGYNDGKSTTVNAIDEDGETLNSRIDRRREIAARNIMKDWALNHLASDPELVAQGDKPKQVLLFGALHSKGLQEAFDDVGLDVTLNMLDVSIKKSTGVLGRAIMGEMVRVPNEKGAASMRSFDHRKTGKPPRSFYGGGFMGGTTTKSLGLGKKHFESNGPTRVGIRNRSSKSVEAKE